MHTALMTVLFGMLQYRYGTTTTAALKHLYQEGGIVRFYRGLGPALLQGPLSRFGDTAANAGTLSLLDSYDGLKGLPIGVKTVAASFSAGAFRILLMPVDAAKTTMQVSCMWLTVEMCLGQADWYVLEGPLWCLASAALCMLEEQVRQSTRCKYATMAIACEPSATF